MSADGFYWRLYAQHGGERVAGPFDTPAEAGRWRRDLEARMGRSWLTLVCVGGGESRAVFSDELVAAMGEYMPARVDEELVL